MFKPTRRGFLQALLAAPVAAPVAAALPPPVEVIPDWILASGMLTVAGALGIGDYVPARFAVPQNPVMGPFAGKDGKFTIVLDGLHPRGIQ